MKSALLTLAFTFVSAMSVASPSQATADLDETLAAEPRFSKFAAAAASARDLLKSAGPYTLLAPTDDAIAKLPAGQWNAVVSSPTLAEKFVRNHTIRGELAFADLRKNAAVETLFGSRFAISHRDEDVLVGGSRVVDADRCARNGVIHAIDTILPTPFVE